MNVPRVTPVVITQPVLTPTAVSSVSASLGSQETASTAHVSQPSKRLACIVRVVSLRELYFLVLRDIHN